MPLSLRPGTPADAPSLSKICLLTGNYGTSAEHLHSRGELLGLVYAEPYVLRDGTFAFVLVDSAEREEGEEGTEERKEEVVGYIIGAYDTALYEAERGRDWFPLLAKKYPVGSEGTDADKYYYGLFASPPKTGQDVLSIYPSHLHIDILPAYQRTGWGRKMVHTIIEHLSSKGYKGVWAGIDSRNEAGRRWYIKLGFRRVESEVGEYWVMDFDRWDGIRGRPVEGA
ncbi:acyl-CoA N-acyltransferase [Dacryopinax primogenitus]|uniref:Acyl-CoA N-acyltransferase n=1 Tax=Dacryopinax primogenitus (strain DJM 731) TaxID=1858805 RepID=M5G8U4_DACPD|nr:acyl-CoA N-acyltransferase [Dacryopinax primogenitus]EJU05154.1 acyl-CoA N-acyltransferase [Dacryopinax primogenitus]